jgi:hypothetical protein
MQVLHETPALARDYIRETWAAGNLTPAEQAVADSRLADQIEQIKISPLSLSIDEISKLWTAIQSKYRPTVVYRVSVVLIEGAKPTRTPLPVLRRGPEDRGPVAVAPPFPSLSRVFPARAEMLPAAGLGEDLVIVGDQLGDAAVVRVTHARLQNSRELAARPAGTTSEVILHIPSAAEDPQVLHTWASGIYTLLLVVRRPNLPAWTTNAVPFALAPTVTLQRPAGTPVPLAVAAGDIVTMSCVPRIRADQEHTVALMLGMEPVSITSIATPADTTQPTTLRFTVPAAPTGEYLVRLRVDGVDSVPVLITGTPPRFEFDPAQKVGI